MSSAPRDPTPPPADDDSAALFAVARHGGALCTVIGIAGSWSRRLGAQLAVLRDGTTRGSLADGCLEAALAREAAAAWGAGSLPAVLRYGAGSPFLDIRLPCGSAIDVAVDPAPDTAATAGAVADLAARRPAALAIPPGHFIRRYLPALRLIVLGSGPEVTALARLAKAQGVACTVAAPHGEPGDIALSLGQPPRLPPGLTVDPWTAIVVLFHDHEWEQVLIPWALATPACYVGAQGGAAARGDRRQWLATLGIDALTIARLRSPIGRIASARTPSVLALSILAEVVAEYEALLEG